ncbi:MAG: hypothetical protein NTZ98_10520 [Acidobacteria bacterium]|nr:hypothetical protein [Acidobacteriota bacterium]
MRYMLIALVACSLLAVCGVAGETAAFDSYGRLTALIYGGGDELALRAGVIAPLAGWKRMAGQAQIERVRVNRGPDATTWEGAFEVEPGRRARFEQTARQTAGKTQVEVRLTALDPLELEGVYLRIDLPRSVFVAGRAQAADGTATELPSYKPPEKDFFKADAAGLIIQDAQGNLKLAAKLERAHSIVLQDKWERGGRTYSALIQLHSGPLAEGASVNEAIAFSVEGKPDTSAAQLTLAAARRRYTLDGFGGNYCFNIESPVTQYTLKNLRVAWARMEMSLREWEPENDNESPDITDWEALAAHDKPDSRLRHEFLLARQLQDKGVPYVTSIWRLPEWLYADAGQQPWRGRPRKVQLEKWGELAESIGSYLVYAKKQYGVEPDLFSFNEANIGVDVLLTPEEHREMIKFLGARFRKLGMKTRMLLADATGPRGTHEYALPAAQDPEAMQYVGAVGFHSWGGATPEHYAAWGDLAEWLRLPLLVTELGVDAGAHRGGMYDSFHYGLREVQMYQEIVMHARPQGTMQWEFTSDYGTVRVKKNADGSEELSPTARFWFVKHFTDLTPPGADVLWAASDNPKVLFTAYAGGRAARRSYTLHIANLGAARSIAIRGIPAEVRSLRAIRTSESEDFQELPAAKVANGSVVIQAAPRSLLTLTTLDPAPSP